MNGSESLFAHVPELRGWRGPFTFVLSLTLFAAASGAMLYGDGLWPQGTLATQVVVLLAGFFTAAPFFWLRKTYKARWGEKAYWKAFSRHIVPGLPLIFAAIAHTAYLPGERVVNGWLTPIVSMLGLYFIVTGLVVWARGGRAIGNDYGLMLYVYFPEESRIVNSAIYAILRHPMYSGAVRVGLALGLWRGTWPSILFGLFMPIGLTIWLRFVEEPELTERFGEGYAEYRRKVPAFWPRPREAGKFFEFLITGH
jgi:protein-S-isoprenylcysteine O-methyltransferase Ste14